MDLKKYIDNDITREEALELCSLTGSNLTELFSVANIIREKYCGDILETCTITNAKSGKCSEDCKFCAQSSVYNTNVQCYPLKAEEIMAEEYKEAEKHKSMRFGIVTSGKGMKKGTEDFERVLKFIEDTTAEGKNSEICCSLGLLSEEEMKELKKAGAKRYHCNLQTSPDTYHCFAATTHTSQDRIRTIQNAKKAGLQVCAGGIIGMGESWKDRIDMAFALKELDVDGVPINILNPIKGTPHGERETLDIDEVLKTIAIFRIILKDKNIKIAAGRENIFKDFMGAGYLAGANGMLVGGYLTVKGRAIEDDFKFIKNIQKIWKR